MMTITFATPQAHMLFHDAASGAWENARDDNEGARAALLGQVIDATDGRGPFQYPAGFALPAGLVATARDVCEDLLDVRESCVIEGDIRIASDDG